MAQASTSTSSKYDPRVHVGLSEERVTDVSSTDFPGYHPDEDHSWDLRKFKKVCKKSFVISITPLNSWCAQKLQVNIQKLSTRSVEFDLVGVDASIANALRRILIAEVRTMITRKLPEALLRSSTGPNSCDRVRIRVEQYIYHGGRGILASPRDDPLERGPRLARNERKPPRSGN